MADWTTELPALIETHGDDNEAIAAAINAIVIQNTVPVRLNFRNFADILNHDDAEYQTVRAVFEAAIAQEKAAGGYLLADMKGWLDTVDGLDFNNAKVLARLGALCALSPALAEVPGKIAAYVASQQPPPRQVYPPVTDHDVAKARGGVQ